MTATTTPPEVLAPAGDIYEHGYELGRYTLFDGERVLYGRRVRGDAIVIDAPAPGQDGRVYLVERDVAADGRAALDALVADYIATATQTGRVPMARQADDLEGSA